MNINELYDPINPLHNRFIDFCTKQGYESIYDLSFFNFFDLELNGYSLIDIINLQDILFQRISSMDCDLDDITTRAQLKEMLSGNGDHMMQVVNDETPLGNDAPESSEVQEVSVDTTSYRAESSLPKGNAFANAIANTPLKNTNNLVVEDFSELTSLGETYDDIYITMISNHVPGFDRSQYKTHHVQTVGDYMYMSTRQLQVLFHGVTMRQFDEFLDLLYFINKIRTIVNEENESITLLSKVSDELFDICYRNKVERFRDFRVINKVIRVYENLSIEMRETLLMELEN